MKTVMINAPSKTYAVRIGGGLLARAGKLAAKVLTPSKALIVTDSAVDALYSETLACSLQSAGFDTAKYVFLAGEKSKGAQTLIALLNFMAQSRMTRTDAVFALGGGVAGDLAGLAAALYMRGTGLVQVPTTLLAAVDSSVGGKTAIDLDAGKNLAGAFYQPDLVICDTDTLSTLPESEFANGAAEVVKYAVIRDTAILKALRRPCDTHIGEIIAACVRIKRDVICADERDTGERRVLNFGHTFGHAVEKCSGYTVPHGSAVAIGMVLITAASVKKGLCEKSCLADLISMLKNYSLPISTTYGESELFDAVLSDKKRTDGRLTLVIPRGMGNCGLYGATLPEAREFLKLGLEGTP